MKKAVNFRLSNQALTTLDILQHELHVSKTTIVEDALSQYAEIKTASRAKLLQYAGILGDKDAKEMLSTIKESRYNKKFKTSL